MRFMQSQSFPPPAVRRAPTLSQSLFGLRSLAKPEALRCNCVSLKERKGKERKGKERKEKQRAWRGWLEWLAWSARRGLAGWGVAKLGLKLSQGLSEAKA